MKRDILQNSGVTVLTKILKSAAIVARQEIIPSDILRQMVANLDSEEYDSGAPANWCKRRILVPKLDDDGKPIKGEDGKIVKTHEVEEYQYIAEPGTPLRDFVDVFYTIDSINRIITDETASLILGRYRPEEYQILQDLKVFIRPKKMVSAAFSNGLVAEHCEDMLSTHQFDDSDLGNELSPTQFLIAQTNMVRFLNPRFRVESCEFVDVVINDQAETETVHLETPVVMMDGSWKTASHMSTLRLFPMVSYRKAFVDSYYKIPAGDEYDDLLVRLFLQMSGQPSSSNRANN